ncbi:MAG: four helix bundle protein [Microcoleaceae cyanobacterium]
MYEIRDFKDLKMWEKGMIIALKYYSLTKKFPKGETYGMIQQITRASVSLPANIAEGDARISAGDYAQFLNIARAWCK